MKVRTKVITTKRGTMVEKGTTTANKTSTGVTMVAKHIGVGPMFRLKIRKSLVGMVEVVWRELRICCRK